MPRNQFQRMVFAFLTVVVTVHAYVFYSLYVVNGSTLMAVTGENSVIAAWLYYPYYAGFNMWTLLANWLKLVCFNLPFAYFSQMFFIQPLIRVTFKWLFRKDIAAREEYTKKEGVMKKPTTETEAIENVLERMDQIEEEEKEESQKK